MKNNTLSFAHPDTLNDLLWVLVSDKNPEWRSWVIEHLKPQNFTLVSATDQPLPPLRYLSDIVCCLANLPDFNSTSTINSNNSSLVKFATLGSNSSNLLRKAVDALPRCSQSPQPSESRVSAIVAAIVIAFAAVTVVAVVTNQRLREQRNCRGFFNCKRTGGDSKPLLGAEQSSAARKG